MANAAAIQSALRSIHAGAVGGGCWPQFEGWLPWWWLLYMLVVEPMVRWSNFLGSGACLFCTRNAFRQTGGFDENHYALEEAVFGHALNRQGRVVIPAETVVTSGRKIRAHSFWSIWCLFTRMTLHGPRGFRSREGLDYWYKPERENVTVRGKL